MQVRDLIALNKNGLRMLGKALKGLERASKSLVLMVFGCRQGSRAHASRHFLPIIRKKGTVARKLGRRLARRGLRGEEARSYLA